MEPSSRLLHRFLVLDNEDIRNQRSDFNGIQFEAEFFRRKSEIGKRNSEIETDVSARRVGGGRGGGDGVDGFLMKVRMHAC